MVDTGMRDSQGDRRSALPPRRIGYLGPQRPHSPSIKRADAVDLKYSCRRHEIAELNGPTQHWSCQPHVAYAVAWLANYCRPILAAYDHSC